jgi:hypothetical protein
VRKGHSAVTTADRDSFQKNPNPKLLRLLLADHPPRLWGQMVVPGELCWAMTSGALVLLSVFGVPIGEQAGLEPGSSGRCLPMAPPADRLLV